jgi:hypothetical protein
MKAISKMPVSHRIMSFNINWVNGDGASAWKIRAPLFKDKQPISDDTHTLTSNYCFRNQVRMVLEKAGFKVEVTTGDWTDADTSVEHDVIVYFAKQ